MKKQLEFETVEVFEQGLQSVFREAKSKENDSLLQRRFVDGIFDPLSSNFFASMPEQTTL